MKRVSSINVVLLLTLVLSTCLTGCSGDSACEQAAVVWQTYINAIRAGDEQTARSCLTPESQGFFEYSSRLRESCLETEFSVIKAQEYADYTELQVIAEKNDLQRGLFRYVVYRNSSCLLEYPFLIFGSLWPVTTSEHFVVHSRSPIRGLSPEALADTITPDTAILEQFYDEITQITGMNYPGPIHYYRCHNVEEVSQLAGMRQVPWFRIGPAIIDCRRHGLSLIVELLTESPRKSMDRLRGGLTMYSELRRKELDEQAADAVKSTNRSISQAIQRFKGHPVLIALTDTPAPTVTGQTNDMALVVGAFFKYLIDTYGPEKFGQLYRGTDTVNDFISQATDVYGVDLETLEKQLIVKYKPYAESDHINSNGEN